MNFTFQSLSGLRADIKNFPLPTMWAAPKVYFTCTRRGSRFLYMYDKNHDFLGIMFPENDFYFEGKSYIMS